MKSMHPTKFLGCNPWTLPFPIPAGAQGPAGLQSARRGLGQPARVQCSVPWTSRGRSASLFSESSGGLLKSRRRTGGKCSTVSKGKVWRRGCAAISCFIGSCEPRQDTGLGKAQAWAWKPAVLWVPGFWGVSTHSLMLSRPAWDSCTRHSHRELP